MVVVAVHDRAADAFARPVFVQSVGQALRSFQDEINRPADQNEMNRHPEDFDLFELGSYDDSTGKLLSLDEPKLIGIGRQMFLSISSQ